MRKEALENVGDNKKRFKKKEEEIIQKEEKKFVKIKT